MPITSEQADSFNIYARNPEIWVLAARRSLAVTRLLMKRYKELSPDTNRDFFESSGCYYASYFHAGVAIENALKAVLISRDPKIVSNGKLNKNKLPGYSGHALLAPVRSILGKLTAEEDRFVIKLEEFVWAGRYTVPGKADVLYDQRKLNIIRMSALDELSILESLVERIIERISK